MRMGGEHALSVVLVEQAREQVGVGLPLVHAVAEERLDLWAREDVGADRVECIDVDDERELLDQGAIAAADLPRGQIVVALAERKRRRRHRSEIRRFGEETPPPDGVSNVVRAPSGALTSVLRGGAFPACSGTGWHLRGIRDDPDVRLWLLPLSEQLFRLVVRDGAGDDQVVPLLPLG